MLMFYVALSILVCLFISPFVVAKSKKYSSKKARHSLVVNIASFCAICLILFIFPFTASAAEATATVAQKYGEFATGMGFLSAALVMGIGSIAAGIAVAAAATSAAGATSENPNLFGKVIVFVVLGEGITVFAFVIAFFILNKI